ncbi:hypothetical protein FQZ97_386310 [compost metagenome]
MNGASLTALTARVTVVESVRLPPLPVLPPSSTLMVSTTLAVALLAVVKLTPLLAMKALMSARLPVSVSAPLPDPLTVTPLLPMAASVPLGTEKVAVTLPAPASTSLMLMPVSAVVTSSFTAMVAGAVSVGASLTAATCRVTVSLALLAPPLPVLPPSSMLAVRVTLAVALLAVMKATLLAAMKALMLAMLPVRVSALAVPPTMTLPPLLAVRLPEPTASVTVTLFVPASASLKLMPVMALATSSVTARVAGAETCGVSLVPLTLTDLLAAVLSRAPSLTVKLTVRVPPSGASLLLA